MDGNWSWFGSVWWVLVFLVLFLLVVLVWLCFCVCSAVLHDLSHSLLPSHKRCEGLHLSQWKGTGLALATYVTSARRRYISFSYGLPVSERSAAACEEKKLWADLAAHHSPWRDSEGRLLTTCILGLARSATTKADGVAVAARRWHGGPVAGLLAVTTSVLACYDYSACLLGADQYPYLPKRTATYAI